MKTQEDDAKQGQTELDVQNLFGRDTQVFSSAEVLLSLSKLVWKRVFASCNTARLIMSLLALTREVQVKLQTTRHGTL